MPTVSVLNTTSQVSGKTLCVAENNQTVSGAWTFSGNQTFTGNVSVGNATSDTLTITSTITSHLLFTDNTYDLGASGATRPRDLFLARNAVIGGTLNVAGAVTLDGNVTLGNAAADGVTVTGTITSNLIFTDNTYDIGASGATRPRVLYLSSAIVIGTTPATSGSIRVPKGSYVVARDSGNTADLNVIGTDVNDNVELGNNTQEIRFMKALVALGGGAGATLGTIGGSGPTVAGQNTWMRWKDSAGAIFWVPVWK